VARAVALFRSSARQQVRLPQLLCPFSGPLIFFPCVERRPWQTLRTSTCVAAPLSYAALAHATQRAIEMVQRAIDEDNKQNYAEAYRQYQNALDYFMLAMKCACARATAAWTVAEALEQTRRTTG
jgi:hypothetical protein